MSNVKEAFALNPVHPRSAVVDYAGVRCAVEAVGKGKMLH
jgi:hypothetical protein